MIVADTNLVAYLLIDGEKTPMARRVWSRDRDWMLPTLWRSEFLNVLTLAVRQKVLTLQQAHDTWRKAIAIFGASEVEPGGAEVLEVATAHNISAYDAQFIAAAIDLDVPLVTSDRRLLAACPDVVIASDAFGG